MIEMQMGQQHVRNVIPVKAVGRQGFVEAIVTMEIVVAKEAGILLVPDAVIHEDEFAVLLDQETTQGPGAEIILICRIDLTPKGFWNYAKHGAAI
jgi:hypothetical protein